MILKADIKNIFLFFLIFIFFFHKHSAISEENEIPLEIANPIFTTKGINEIPYTIKASSGIQKGNILELIEIEGKIKNHNNVWIYLNADKGNYNQNSQIVFLYHNIVVYTDNKEKLESDEAIIDMQQDTITLLSNVIFENQLHRIEADKSIIKNDFQNFNYFGNVKTNINSY